MTSARVLRFAVKTPAVFNSPNLILIHLKSDLMKKKSEKKLKLGKIKIANLNQTKERPHAAVASGDCTVSIDNCQACSEVFCR